MPKPPVHIPWDKVEEMAKRHCTGEEIAASLGIHADTLGKRIKKEYKMGMSAYLQEKRASGRTILRKHQFEVAEGGNVAMLIFLGKQYLGQSEKTESKVDQTVNLPQFVWEDGTPEQDNG